MTLKSRNRFIFLSSAFLLAASALLLLYFFYKLRLTDSGQAFFHQTFFGEGFSFFHYNTKTVILGTILIALYIPFSAFYLYAHFEKTPSTEIIYFMLFLLGCLPETLRLFIPIETMQNGFPKFLVLIGRALFWGRSLSVISLFCGAVSIQSKSIDAEQNIFIILVFSLALSAFVPINTMQVSQAFSVKIGSASFVHLLYIAGSVLTFCSYAVAAHKNEDAFYLKIALDVLFIECGLAILCSTGRLLLLAAGLFLLLYGTIQYFRQLHQLYL